MQKIYFLCKRYYYLLDNNKNGGEILTKISNNRSRYDIMTFASLRHHDDEHALALFFAISPQFSGSIDWLQDED